MIRYVLVAAALTAAFAAPASAQLPQAPKLMDMARELCIAPDADVAAVSRLAGANGFSHMKVVMMSGNQRDKSSWQKTWPGGAVSVLSTVQNKVDFGDMKGVVTRGCSVETTPVQMDAGGWLQIWLKIPQGQIPGGKGVYAYRATEAGPQVLAGPNLPTDEAGLKAAKGDGTLRFVSVIFAKGRTLVEFDRPKA